MNTEDQSKKPVQGIIFYCDGGVRPNPGFGGWGVHGYLFSTEVPKQSSGNPDNVVTANGYVSKIDANILNAGDVKQCFEVTAISYIDAYGSFPEPITNNIAEIVAATRSLIAAKEYDVATIQIFTDSEHVCNGIKNWRYGWERNGWIKSDKTEVANAGYWKELIAVHDDLVSRGTVVSVDWVRGHNGDPGNEKADKLATVGVMCSRANDIRNDIVWTPAKGYWKNATDKHPFVANRRMYFNTDSEFNTPGEYYLGEHGKDDDMLGKRISDGAYSVVILEKPENVLELVRNYQSLMANNVDTIVMIRLDKLYREDTHDEVTRYGTMALVRENSYRLDLACLDKQPLTREMRPPMLAMRAVESIEVLSRKLQEFLSGNESIVVTDLTPIIYETTLVKSGKSTKVTKSSDGDEGFRTGLHIPNSVANAAESDKPLMKLRPEFNVGYAALPVEANYESETGLKTAPITLTLGLDLLDRNALKRLEDSNPKVSLISWLESPNVFRYATVIESGNDKGIWAGVYSNTRVV